MQYKHYEGLPGLEIVFSNGQDPLSLFYVIYEWPAAQTFYTLVKESLENYPIYSDTSFNINKDDEIKLLEDINFYVNKINEKYGSNISIVETDSDLNVLHREVASNVDCELWSIINDRIHAYEQYKNQFGNEPRINAYFRFKTTKTIPLEKTDFLFFKADREYGDLCLNYTYKGKHWLELQSDNDLESVFDGQLQPETRISPSGYLLFRPPSPSPFYRLNRFVNWFKESFPNKEIESEMAIGYLLVGKLIMPSGWNDFYVPNRSKWTKMLSAYKEIIEVKAIEIKDAEKLIEKSRMI
jgi:hypothetical protein